ncbi:hypothetical protein RF55_18897 [Lasius niger]|uniref:Uncharacterized protein n=1 Tax=Lasius niger TaxID=67767 RepID=A0A0J7K0N0_LASNI|nr:hypothetical protein RF55_18897 [Lasius niger]
MGERFKGEISGGTCHNIGGVRERSLMSGVVGRSVVEVNCFLDSFYPREGICYHVFLPSDVLYVCGKLPDEFKVSCLAWGAF